jgi:DNA-binding transcriptional LysR family regulator
MNFRLLQGPAPTLLSRLISGDVDLCLVSPRFEEPQVEWLPISEEELFVLVRETHPLARKRSVKLKDIAEEAFISLKPGYGLRRVTDQLCAQAGFKPRINFEGEEVSTLWGLVGAGLGIAIGPRLAVTAPGTPTAVQVSEPRCSRTIGLAWMKKRIPVIRFQVFLGVHSRSFQTLGFSGSTLIDRSHLTRSPSAQFMSGRRIASARPAIRRIFGVSSYLFAATSPKPSKRL